VDERAWLGRVPAMRWERHYDRVVRCFAARPHNAYDLLGEAAARNADGEALVCGADRLSLPRIRKRGRALRRRARGGGIGPGDRVALLLHNGIAFPLVLFAALRLGAIAVPLSVREQTQGLAYMLAHSGAELLVHDADLADRLPEGAATPALAHRIAVEPGAPWSTMRLLAPPRGSAPAAVQEEDTAIILYTSGTTGRPKGAMLTHLGICHSAMHYDIAWG
jgi:acyl-CoA synthetase (AMP-forming)/AMP-acid ligase II